MGPLVFESDRTWMTLHEEQVVQLNAVYTGSLRFRLDIYVLVNTKVSMSRALISNDRVCAVAPKLEPWAAEILQTVDE